MAEVKTEKAEVKLTSLKVQKDAPMRRAEPDEWYKAEFTKAELGKGNFGPYIKMTFKLLSGQTEDGQDARGLTINALTDAVISPSRPLWKFAAAMLGREPKIEEDLDLTAFYGEKFRVFVTDRVPKKGATNQKVYQHVTTIKRLKKKEG